MRMAEEGGERPQPPQGLGASATGFQEGEDRKTWTDNLVGHFHPFFFNVSAFWSGEIAKVVKIHQNERIQNGNDMSCLGFEFNQGFQLLSLICTETLTADFLSPKPF